VLCGVSEYEFGASKCCHGWQISTVILKPVFLLLSRTVAAEQETCYFFFTPYCSAVSSTGSVGGGGGIADEDTEVLWYRLLCPPEAEDY
jgi:hypothetical protein